ncbi:MAG: cupin domain-containing protein [Kordiimonadaceae bacterium]|nr:cupin domain-containing protein [Kordiimonadaceae bacterium]MBO6568825.1 cupin domain-containing protein [Kordiimonadaceae bacterium]MBO6965200.1 cupin domain-containing protein [Kordiimonadaceae bacterium]
MRLVGIAVGMALSGVLSLSGGAQDQDAPDYEYTTKGTTIYEASNGFLAKVLVEAANLGSEDVKIAEMTFPVGYAGQGHLHGALEIFYVLEGRFGHSVNGVDGILEVGEVGIVKAGDTVTHSVHGDTPAKVLTIWVPGGEAAVSFDGLPSHPVD